MDIGTLISILNPKVLEKHTELPAKKGQRSFVLKEEEIDATLRKIFITDCSENTYVVKLDGGNFPDMKYFLHSEGGICRRCDYLIFTISNEKVVILLIELKSETWIPKEVEEKFKASQAIIGYLTSIIKSFHHKKLTLDDLRFILLHKTSSRGRGTVIKKTVLHTTPSKFLKRPCHDGDHISLNEVTEKGLLGVLILLLWYSCRLFTRCKRPNSVPRASLSHPTKPFSVTSNILLKSTDA